MGMTEQQDRSAAEREVIAAEREEITSRVATFKATQKKFEREREEYFVTTLENARHGENSRHGFERPPFWS
jgi:chorismate mutase